MRPPAALPNVVVAIRSRTHYTITERKVMISPGNPEATQSSVDDITGLPAARLIRHIANGDISAVEAVEAHIDRIERVNPQLNAMVLRRYNAAREEARFADEQRSRGERTGALHGLPVTIKESLDLKGAPSTFGVTSRASSLATADEPHVARFRNEGAIVLGKTNVAQLLFYYESDNPLHGRTNNPWRLDRTPGGSSGGEAAIIATGGSAMGLGTDIGGSIRVPAHFCGLAGLKPTEGRTPDMGRFSVPIGQRIIPSQVGVLARHVEDVALGLEVINGGRNPDVEPPMPLADFRDVDLRSLRVAWYADDGTFDVAPAVSRAVREAAERLRQAGARVSPWTPPGVPHALQLFYAIFTADGGRLLRTMLGRDRRAPQIAQLLALARLPQWLIRSVQGMLHALGQYRTASSMEAFGHDDTAHYWTLVEMVLEYRERFRQALDQNAGGPFDLIIAPPCALPAFTHGATKDLLTAGAYACLYNVLGYPAGVVPATRVREDEQTSRADSRDRIEKITRQVEEASAGLPVGVQVIARPWREHVALAAMHAIEQGASASPDFPRTPVMIAGEPAARSR